MRPEDVLSDALLDRIRGRAAGYDRDNAFFHEDLADLAAAGYLKIFVPESDGGFGLGLAAAAALQRRLATAAPATALAINMHLVWTGVAHVLAARGDSSLDYVLKEAGQGEIFAFGNSEPGNDSVLFDSRTTAVPQAGGGYAFTGRKIFTSLSPVWTRLGIFGKDSAAADGAGQLVHGFITRETPGYEILPDWDTLGMRASQSNTTVLADAVVPPERIFRKLPVGPNADPLIFAIFACFETLLAAVYTGIGERALSLGVQAVKRRTSFKNGGRSYAQDPDIRWKVADAAMAMDALYPQLASVATDVDSLADHGGQWFPKLVGLKVSATETARTVVDLAIRVSGGSSYFRGSELERLYRDVLAGMFHPSDDESAHNTVASAWLGPLDPDA
ncbi:acyl-CoA dehydrogenase family protein [Arthrobacter sp. AL08]|uniref:acyl-CoA dehydrogenase family protein n=1 Tax=Micrococcaceae TaxID=1268 RepID=UPI001CFFE386|nr:MULTISPECIES: acyl-CoA dehydrogenase family protein [Micrococcaceae]MCB5283291.1 putative acyl-CoA dehydrogenase YdbM [Arthrobacter sp. ES1]MDI3241786.1 acyl-CoA dehydrogenase family protein [Arthrobacter sp. AL05]MDI3277890.1 acyl-CoA dehydrogenase family protein [Arthrobacter sp. AL08]MDJ0351736.1 acyl-CoA dehydrogenase family protein [Pseudarthrobacter sp. PH31-O2]WGZ81129.1 acyl-CoA dehydrogenase family protein [Arthrobacter sp. EM1]